MAWNFKREESKNFNTKIPEGKHRIRIKEVDKAVSKNGNDMLTLKFEVSGYNGLIFHHIVFMADRPEITNRMLTQFYDSFKAIPEGDTNIGNWTGKVGACVVKHEEYNGQVNAKIHYFIAADKQGDLPPWKEPSGNDSGSGASGNADGEFMAIPDVAEQLPF